MKTSLCKLEMRLYIMAWGAGVAASAYHYYIGQEELLASKNITRQQLPGLTEGWNVVQRLKDDSDADWSAWKYYLRVSWLPLVFHFIVSELLRNSFMNLIPFWYILFTAVFTSWHFKSAQTLLLFTQPMVYVLVIYLTKKKVWIWITSLILLALLNYLKKDVLFWYLFEQNLDIRDIYLVLVSLSWIQVRCISFSFDHINGVEKSIEKEETDGVKERIALSSAQIENREIEMKKETDGVKERIALSSAQIENRETKMRKETEGVKERIALSSAHIENRETKMKKETDRVKERIALSLAQTENRETEMDFYAEKKFINEDIKNLKQIERFRDTVAGIMSYSLYFPTLFMGPLVLHSDFTLSLHKLEQCLSVRLKRFAKDITIFLAEACLMELILHYLYFLAMKEDVRLVRMFRNSGLCGAGLFMGVQFYLKYLVLYGASGALVALHGAPPPPAPRCILRVHLYSHMWKHFDVGLYRFLVKYMYKPTLTALCPGGRSSTAHKLLAAVVTFSFIFLWHGTTLVVLLWSSLNFAGVALEALGTFIGTTKTYDTFRNRVLMTPQAEERFIAVISTPMLIMSFASNIYFFAGIEVGNVFLERFFSESWYNILLVCFCLHACCHGSAAMAYLPSRTGESKRKEIKN